MKLWDSLTTCLILLGAVHASWIRQQSAKRKGSAAENPLELPPVQMRLAVFAQAVTVDWEETLAGERKGKLWIICGAILDYCIHHKKDNEVKRLMEKDLNTVHL